MKRLFAFFTTLVICLGAYAQSAMPFVGIDRNPVTAAMGGANAVSSLYNPAAAAVHDGGDFVLNYQKWAPASLSENHIGFLGEMKLGKKLGLTLIGASQKGQSYTAVDGSGNAGKTFTPTELLAGAGIGFRFTENLAAGATVKYASQKIDDKSSYSAILADVLVYYNKEKFSAAAGLTSLGTPVTSGDNSYPLPLSVKAGAGYKMDSFRVNADIDYYLSGGFGAGGGAEYSFKDMLFVRAGAHLGSGSAPLPTYASLGAGFKFAGFHADLCWLTANGILGNTLHLGLGYSF